MCHSENKYGDKLNKNLWGLQTVDITRKIHMAIKSLGCELCIG